MKEKRDNLIGLFVVLLLVLFGVTVFNFQSDDGVDTVGSTILGSNERCQDTDSSLAFVIPESDLVDTGSVFIKGNVLVRNPLFGGGGGSTRTFYDSCSANVLTEYYCSSSAKIASEEVVCLNGCDKGKCLLPLCKESEKGLNFMSKETVVGLMVTDLDAKGAPPATHYAKNYTDSCSANVLTEFYCQDFRTLRSRSFNCTSFGGSYSCLDGRCINY